MHKPYTYLLVWNTTGVKYYGVRYSKDCTPSDLWSTYFTSSKSVKEYRKLHGEPDIIQVRKTFNNSQAARLWEHNVLRKLNCAKRNDYLNKTDAVSFPTYETKEQHPNYNRKRDDIQLKFSKSKWYNNGTINKRCQLNNIPEGFTLGRLPFDTSATITRNHLRKGTTLSDSHRLKVVTALIKNNKKRKGEKRKGRKMSEETKRKISETLRNKHQK